MISAEQIEWLEVSKTNNELLFINPNSIIDDYFLLMGISSFFTGIIFFIRIITHYNIRLEITDFKSGILVIRKSFRLFISGIWESLKNCD